MTYILSPIVKRITLAAADLLVIAGAVHRLRWPPVMEPEKMPGLGNFWVSLPHLSCASILVRIDLGGE